LTSAGGNARAGFFAGDAEWGRPNPAGQKRFPRRTFMLTLQALNSMRTHHFLALAIAANVVVIIAAGYWLGHPSAPVAVSAMGVTGSSLHAQNGGPAASARSAAAQSSRTEEFPIASPHGLAAQREPEKLLAGGGLKLNTRSIPFRSAKPDSQAEPARSPAPATGASPAAADAASGSADDAPEAPKRFNTGALPAAAPTPQAKAAVPLAFLEPTPAMSTDPRQMAMLQDLRTNFINDAGGPNQDPADPAYLHRWETAQEISDDQFRARFGWEAFVAQQLQSRALQPAPAQAVAE
jgi:hypothetical protein